MGFLDLVPLVTSVIDRIFPDPTAAAAAKLEVMKLQVNDAEFTAKLAADFEQKQMDLQKAQIDVNTAEATNPNLLVSGWRPMIGWVCAAAFACTYVLMPLIAFIFSACDHPIPNLPKLDMSDLMPVLLGMLGLGGMRTYERVKGVVPKGK